MVRLLLLLLIAVLLLVLLRELLYLYALALGAAALRRCLKSNAMRYIYTIAIHTYSVIYVPPCHKH
jgi:hypothetical protein